jgi:hypothetical protein
MLRTPVTLLFMVVTSCRRLLRRNFAQSDAKG